MHSWQIKTTAIRIAGATMLVAILSIMMMGVADAHPSQKAEATGQSTAFLSFANNPNLPPDISKALKQIDPKLLAASQQAYEEGKLHPEKIHVETRTIDLSKVNFGKGVKPHLFIPGIGSITVRQYWLGSTPAGFGVFIPQSTAKNLKGVGAAAATAITAAIVNNNPGLLPFSPVIGVILGNILNSLPGYIDDTCGSQGGGFTVNFIVAVPIPFCGDLPAWPL